MKLRYLLCAWAIALAAGIQGGELKAQWLKALTQWGKSDAEDQSTSDQPDPNARFPRRLNIDRAGDMKPLRDRMRKVLTQHYSQPLNSRDNDSWELMHSIIAYGVDAELRVGGPQGPRRNAIGYLCYNYPLRGPRMLSVQNNLPSAQIGVGLQGHQAQMLAILAQSRLSRTYPLLINGQKFTIEDLIRAEQLACRTGTELTFTLISMAHYLPTDAKWTCSRGETWDIPRLIREEIRQPITHSAACGGTHRLMGLSYAIRRREQQGKPIDGDFARAKEYLQNYFDWTLSLQNPDGSFSTSWLARRENRADIDRKIQCTGHITEWLVYALPKARLRDEPIVAAVGFLTSALEMNRGREWKVGPLGHALHALALYHQRVFEGQEDQPAQDQPSLDQTEPPTKPEETVEVATQVPPKSEAPPAEVVKAPRKVTTPLMKTAPPKEAVVESQPLLPGAPVEIKPNAAEPTKPQETPEVEPKQAVADPDDPPAAAQRGSQLRISPAGPVMTTPDVSAPVPAAPEVKITEPAPKLAEPKEPADALDLELFRVMQVPAEAATQPEGRGSEPATPATPALTPDVPRNMGPALQMLRSEASRQPVSSSRQVGLGSAAGGVAGLIGSHSEAQSPPLELENRAESSSESQTKEPIHVGLRPTNGAGPALVAPR